VLCLLDELLLRDAFETFSVWGKAVQRVFFELKTLVNAVPFDLEAAESIQRGIHSACDRLDELLAWFPLLLDTFLGE
jgi:hypothetical protein